MRRVFLLLSVLCFVRFAPAPLAAQEAPDTTAAVKVYPNPNNGHFWVIASSKILERSVWVGLYDLTGQVIQSQVLSASRPQAAFDLPQIPEGLYYLQARTPSKTINIKVFIQ